MNRTSAILILTICAATSLPQAAWCQANGGGMFPDVPRGDQNNPPRSGGQFPVVPRGDQNNPNGNLPRPGTGQPPPDRGHRPPVIIVSPSWIPRGSAASDERSQAIQRALAGAAGVTVTWISGNSSGQITPLGDRIVSGLNCRDLQQSVTTLGNTDQGLSTYCLTPAGEWMLLGP